MSDDSTGGIERAVSRENVSVRRTVETDGTEVITTTELRSATDEPVLVEVVEALPDDLPLDAAGFQPEAVPNATDVSDNRLIFEQVVGDEPEEVVYELQLSEPVSNIDLAPPTLETVEPVAAGFARDSSVGSSGVTADGEPTVVSDGGSRQRGEQRVDVRLDRLSARVEEFAAYAESLGALVDERGTPSEFVDRFDERIDEVNDRVADTRTELREEVGAVRGNVDSLDEEVDALRDELDEAAAAMERVREETATLREELGELQAERGSLSEALTEWTARPAEDGDDSGGDVELATTRVDSDE